MEGILNPRGEIRSRMIRGMEKENGGWDGEEKNEEGNESASELPIVLHGNGVALFRFGGEASAHGANHPRAAKGEEGQDQCEETIEVARNGSEELEIGGLLERAVTGNEAELGDNPGREKGDAGDRRARGVDQVGKKGPGNAKPIGNGASHPPDHEGIGETVEEADQAQTKDAGEKSLPSPIVDFSLGSEKGQEAAAPLHDCGERSQKQGKDQSAKVPGALHGAPESALRMEPVQKVVRMMDRKEEKGAETGGRKRERCGPGCED
jgi:hypothetical protein